MGGPVDLGGRQALPHPRLANRPSGLL